MRHSGLVCRRHGMAILTRELFVVGRHDVAITAHGSLVRKPEEGMVENRAGPRRGCPAGMAGRARSRIIRGNVIRHVGSERVCVRVIVLVAAIAVGSRKTRGVVASGMTVSASIDHRTDCTRDGRARRQHMRTLQWEPRPGVVKLSMGPENGVVARRTHGSRESGSHVVRHTAAERRGALPRGLVAPIAIRVCRCQVVVVPRVAIRTSIHLAGWRELVRAGQRPAGSGVVEHDIGPQRRVVTGGAIGRRKRRACCRVRRVIGLLPSRQVASGIPAVARLDLQIVVVVDVAVGAGIYFTGWY